MIGLGTSNIQKYQKIKASPLSPAMNIRCSETQMTTISISVHFHKISKSSLYKSLSAALS